MKKLILAFLLIAAPVKADTVLALSVTPNGSIGNVASINDLVFNRVNSLAYAYSAGKQVLTGTAAEVSVPYDLGLGCNASLLISLANNAATAAGYNLSSYQIKLYFINNISGCAIAGSAGFGFAILFVHDPEVVIHELGHVWGLDEGKGILQCNNGLMIQLPLSSCLIGTYANMLSVMGNGHGHYDLPDKDVLKWASVTSLASSGFYTFSNLESFSPTTKGVKLAHSFDQFNRVRWLYLEYRTGIPEVFLTLAEGNSNYLLDSRPETFNYFWDGGIEVGRSLTEPISGVSIRAVELTESTATVEISHPYPALSCSPATQTVGVSSFATVTATGGTGTYKWYEKGGINIGSGSSLTTLLAPGVQPVTVVSPPQAATCVINFGSSPSLGKVTGVTVS